MSRVAGVDGFRDGWVVALVTGREVDWRLCRDAGAVLAAARDCAVVGVDIPMGLPDTGRRQCDVAAAEQLGPARSSVFPAPPRAVLGTDDYHVACDLARVASGNAISKQTWNIVPKIREWEQLLDAAAQDRVIEVHPELSVRHLAGRSEFARKRSARGAGQRIAALSRYFDLAGLSDIPDGPALDDALDALAAAYSAARWAGGHRYDVLGDDTRDARGLLMRIVV
jgi:predicted RNase H-like nuclease